jgi:hypothetical protein
VGSWALHGDPEGLDGWLWFHRLTPLMTLLAALLPTFVALRRVRPPPIAWIGAIALCGIFVAGATAAPLVGTLGMWLWPLCWGQPRGRRVALLAVSALPLVSMLLVLAAVFASYGSSVFDRESIAPLVELAVAAAGMAAMFLATQPPVEAPRQPDETSGSAST